MIQLKLKSVGAVYFYEKINQLSSFCFCRNIFFYEKMNNYSYSFAGIFPVLEAPVGIHPEAASIHRYPGLPQR